MGSGTARIAAAVTVVWLISGCSGGDGVEHQPPDLSASPDAVVVVGTGVCSMRNEGFYEEDGVYIVLERFICEDTMSDPRVTGTEELVVKTKYVDETTGGIWTAGEATLTTDDGIWRGTAWGIVDLAGVLPWAKGSFPFNYGEAHWIGEGPYEGLEYHWYITGSNSEAAITGWIRRTDD